MSIHEINDSFQLHRFLEAQEHVYKTALSELKHGRKRSHWMWFIFPQIDGLGRSPTARRYAVKSVDEAAAYLAHPILGPRLRECTGLVLNLDGVSASDVFGYPDDLKFRSSMTLFEHVTSGGSVFARALEKYYHGEPDQRTLDIIGTQNI